MVYKKSYKTAHSSFKQFILLVVLFGIAVDFLGFIAWVASNQLPESGFYVGRLTVEVIKVIL